MQTFVDFSFFISDTTASEQNKSFRQVSMILHSETVIIICVHILQTKL